MKKVFCFVVIFLLFPVVFAIEDETRDFHELERRIEQKRLPELERQRLQREFTQKEQVWRQQHQGKVNQFRQNLDKIKEFEKRKLRNLDPQKAELARKKISEIEQKLNRLETTKDFRERRKLIEELKKDREQIQSKVQEIRELKKDIREIKIQQPEIERLRKRFESLPPQKRERVERILKKKLFSIKRERRVYSIKDPETNKETKTTEFAIQIPEGNLEIIEEIPKSVAKNVNQISFSVEPEVIEEDPVVKWAFQNTPQKDEKKYSQTEGVKTFNETSSQSNTSIVQSAITEITYSVDGEVEDLSTTIAAEADEQTEQKQETKEEIKQETKQQPKITKVQEKQGPIKKFFGFIRNLF